jgi:GDP-L-fucose synthase
MLSSSARIFVAGASGLVGSAIVRALVRRGFTAISAPPRRELDLFDRDAVDRYFRATRPEYVFLAAAKVGGIAANRDRPADFLTENLRIQTNVLELAHLHRVTKLLFLGSSCIYPRLAPQPIREEYLLTGPLEPTNEAYAVAKIAGIKMCESYNRQYGTRFIAAMPTNVYGPGDNFDPRTGHFVAALIRKLHEAARDGRPVTLWGTGAPRRELIHADDLAGALLLMMERFEATPELGFLNVGSGEDRTIAELAGMIAETVGYRGAIDWDRSMPDGTPQKRLDVSRVRELGFAPKISIEDGLRETHRWFSERVA